MHSGNKIEMEISNRKITENPQILGAKTLLNNMLKKSQNFVKNILNKKIKNTTYCNMWDIKKQFLERNL